MAFDLSVAPFEVQSCLDSPRIICQALGKRSYFGRSFNSLCAAQPIRQFALPSFLDHFAELLSQVGCPGQGIVLLFQAIA